MKFWRILSGILAVCCAAGLIGATIAVDRGGKLRYTGELMRGDPAAFEGLSVETETLWSDHLVWTTDYTPSDDTSACTRRYHPFGVSSNDFTPSLWLNIDFFAHDPAITVVDLEQQLRDQMPEGATEWEETIRVAEYFDRLPIEAVAYVDEAHRSSVVTDEGRQVFRDFFSLPVPEDATLSVQLWPGGMSATAEANVPSLDTCSVLGADGCWYFTVDLRDSEGRPFDVRTIPGGAGVYRYDPAALNIENICSFPAETWIDDLRLSEDGRKLLLLSELDGAGTLTLLDCTTGAVTQQFDLPTPTDEAYYAMWYRDGLLVLTDLTQTLSVFTEADGAFTLRATLDAAGDPVLEEWGAAMSFAYDGVRLAAAVPILRVNGSGSLLSCHDLAISVYDETGARHTMEAKSSLSPDAVHRIEEGNYTTDTSVTTVKVRLS